MKIQKTKIWVEWEYIDNILHCGSYKSYTGTFWNEHTNIMLSDNNGTSTGPCDRTVPTWVLYGILYSVNTHHT